VSNGDHLDSVPGFTIDNEEWKTPQKETACVSAEARPTAWSFRDRGKCLLKLFDEALGRPQAPLSIHSTAASAIASG